MQTSALRNSLTNLIQELTLQLILAANNREIRPIFKNETCVKSQSFLGLHPNLTNSVFFQFGLRLHLSIVSLCMRVFLYLVVIVAWHLWLDFPSHLVWGLISENVFKVLTFLFSSFFSWWLAKGGCLKLSFFRNFRCLLAYHLDFVNEPDGVFLSNRKACNPLLHIR